MGFEFRISIFKLRTSDFGLKVILVRIFQSWNETQARSVPYLRLLEGWNTGILEYWNTGILEYWNVGMLECWTCKVESMMLE